MIKINANWILIYLCAFSFILGCQGNPEKDYTRAGEDDAPVVSLDTSSQQSANSTNATLNNEATSERKRTHLANFGPEVLQTYTDCESLRDDLDLAGRAVVEKFLWVENVIYNVNYKNSTLVSTTVAFSGSSVDTTFVSISTTAFATTTLISTNTINNVIPVSSPFTTAAATTTAVATTFITSSNSSVPTTLVSTGSIPQVSSMDSTSTTSNNSPNTVILSEYSTNNQVEKVDEPDIVKSNGKFIFLIYGGEVVVQDLEGRIVERLTLARASNSGYSYTTTSFIAPQSYTSESIKNILLTDDYLFVMMSKYTSFFNSQISSFQYENLTVLKLFQINKDGRLSLKQEKQLLGNYREGRMINDYVYLVTDDDTFSYSYELTQGLARYQTNDYTLNEIDYRVKVWAEVAPRLEVMKDKYIAKIASNHAGLNQEQACRRVMTLNSRLKSSSEQEKLDLIHYPFLPGSDFFSILLQLHALKLNSDLPTISQASFLTSRGNLTLYSNLDTLVIGNSGWELLFNGSLDSTTQLIGFKLKEGQITPYTTGNITGLLLNQYSMDLYQEHLRSVSYKSSQFRWDGEGRWTIVSESNSLLSIQKFTPLKMEKTAEISGMGKGERLFSVRFVADRGFVVTFRTIDPFYTLDLADPKNPKLAGELKISGFSNYLHPLDRDTLLAVGSDVDPNTNRTLGNQVAVFDVSDFANPKQMFKYVNADSFSTVAWDFKAFRYLERSGKLILPLQNYSSINKFDGFQIFNISKQNGIQLQGTISHFDQQQTKPYCYGFHYLPSRSLVFGEQLVTLKGHSVMSHKLETLEKQWESILDKSENTSTCYSW